MGISRRLTTPACQQLKYNLTNLSECIFPHLAPAHSTTVVDADVSSAAQRVSDHILNGHVSAPHRAVCNVGCLSVGRVRSTHIVVVT